MHSWRQIDLDGIRDPLPDGDGPYRSSNDRPRDPAAGHAALLAAGAPSVRELLDARHEHHVQIVLGLAAVTLLGLGSVVSLVRGSQAPTENAVLYSEHLRTGDEVAITCDRIDAFMQWDEEHIDVCWIGTRALPILRAKADTGDSLAITGALMELPGQVDAKLQKQMTEWFGFVVDTTVPVSVVVMDRALSVWTPLTIAAMTIVWVAYFVWRRRTAALVALSGTR